MIGIGSMVMVRPMDGDEFPLANAVAGHIGLIEDLMVDSDGDTAALLWFGSRIPVLHNDGCWIYVEFLELAPEYEEA
jgi:hypothetical protein